MACASRTPGRGRIRCRHGRDKRRASQQKEGRAPPGIRQTVLLRSTSGKGYARGGTQGAAPLGGSRSAGPPLPNTNCLFPHHGGKHASLGVAAQGNTERWTPIFSPPTQPLVTRIHETAASAGASAASAGETVDEACVKLEWRPPQSTQCGLSIGTLLRFVQACAIPRPREATGVAVHHGRSFIGHCRETP